MKNREKYLMIQFLIFHRDARTLTYEELLPFIIDPYWIRMRKLTLLFVYLVFLLFFFMAFITAARYKNTIGCSASKNHIETTTNSYLLSTIILAQDLTRM